MTPSAPRWTSGRDRWGLPAHRPIPFAPVVDGDVLPVTPWQALADGAGRDVELLVGHTRDEQRLFTAIDGLLGEVTEEQAATALDVFAPGPDGARRYREAFPDAGPEELYELVHSDWLFRMPSLHLAEAQAAAGGRAHVYELTWPAPGMGGALGACHGLDVPLVFGNLDRGQPAMLIGDPPSARGRGAVRRGCAPRGRRSPPTATPAGPRTTPSQRLVQLFDTAAGGHRLPGGGLPADLAGPRLPRPPAARVTTPRSRGPRPMLPGDMESIPTAS